MTRSLPVIGQEPEIPLYTGHLEGKLNEHLICVSRYKVADTITGGLSSPGKMPCSAWGISASRCRVGSTMDGVEGSVCNQEVCYAKQRNYKREWVQSKLEQRYQGLFHPLWTPAMIFLINHHCEQYFRWFDSGDIQGENHLKNMVTIARFTPDVLHWCPSKEVTTVRNLMREMAKECIEWPENFRVRLSANMIDGKPPRGFDYTSTVVSDTEKATCIAQLQKNRCDGEVGSCRACWEQPGNVSYPLH